jgi:hypothetical protein
VSKPTFRGDYFDRARRVAVAILVLAAVLGILGSFLDWIVITELPPEPEAGFGHQRTVPYAGVDARDGWIVIGAAVVLLAATAGLALRRRTAWIAFIASIVMGAVAFSAYREVGNLSSAISRRMDIVGDPEPAIGVALVAIGGVAALLGSVLGMISSPRAR